MKKIAIIIAVCAVMVTVLCACTNVDYEKKLSDNITFAEYEVYEGMSDNFDVKYTEGVKEELMGADGKVGNLINYSTLRIVPKYMDLFDKEYSYKLTGEKGEAEGIMTKDMFGISYSAQVENAAELGTLQQVTVSYDDKSETIVLTDMLKDFISTEQIISIVAKEFKNELEEFDNAEVFPREVYIKFINDSSDEANPYYFYVSVIGGSEDYWSILIEPRVGTVINKRV